MKQKNNISLEEIGNRMPFNIPENYFEDFALQIESQTATARVSVFKIIKPWLYMAAMFAGVFVVGNIFYSVHQKNIAKNAENYELYMVSQVDESLVYDNYIDVQSQEAGKK